MSLGPTLARLRAERGLSLRAVGTAIGRSASAVLAHETGTAEVPADLFGLYGDLYGVQLATLVLPGDVPALGTLDAEHQAALVDFMRHVGAIDTADLPRLAAIVRSFAQPLK